MVNLVVHSKNHNRYAMKVMRFDETVSEREKRNALNEIKYLAKIRHPNVIGYRAAFFDEECLCLVMEYASHGDLQKLIRFYAKREARFSEA